MEERYRHEFGSLLDVQKESEFQSLKDDEEKDLVLDVALRVGKLVQDRMNAEVIYTRADDTFIPLEGRTALANEKKADLFLSIHANSSTLRTAAGVETYYLSFATSRSALEVAARENSASQKTVYELQDLLETGPPTGAERQAILKGVWDRAGWDDPRMDAYNP